MDSFARLNWKGTPAVQHSVSSVDLLLQLVYLEVRPYSTLHEQPLTTQPVDICSEGILQFPPTVEATELRGEGNMPTCNSQTEK